MNKNTKIFLGIFSALLLIFALPVHADDSQGLIWEADGGVYGFGDLDFSNSYNGSGGSFYSFDTEGTGSFFDLTVTKPLGEGILPESEGGSLQFVFNSAIADNSQKTQDPGGSNYVFTSVDGDRLASAIVVPTKSTFEFEHDHYGLDILIRSDYSKEEDGCHVTPYFGFSYLYADDNYFSETRSIAAPTIVFNFQEQGVQSNFYGGKLGAEMKKDVKENVSLFVDAGVGLFYMNSELSSDQTLPTLNRRVSSDDMSEFAAHVDVKGGLDWNFSWGSIGVYGGVDYFSDYPQIKNISGSSANLIKAELETESITNWKAGFAVTIPLDDFLARL